MTSHRGPLRRREGRQYSCRRFVGEGWEYPWHGFLVSLPCREGVARSACS
jgi:hypothetical protein